MRAGTHMFVLLDVRGGAVEERLKRDQKGERELHRVPLVVFLAGAAAGGSATHEKFAASSELPAPFHRATCG